MTDTRFVLAMNAPRATVCEHGEWRQPSIGAMRRYDLWLPSLDHATLWILVDDALGGEWAMRPTTVVNY